MDNKLDIVAIGESLIELSTNAKMSAAGCLYKYYGGDALATAISALRMGSRVGFITRIGNDPFKDFLLDSWEAEGLDISQVKLTSEPLKIFLKSILQILKLFMLPVLRSLFRRLPRKLLNMRLNFRKKTVS